MPERCRAWLVLRPFRPGSTSAGAQDGAEPAGVDLLRRAPSCRGWTPFGGWRAEVGADAGAEPVYVIQHGSLLLSAFDPVTK
jgi:hypothetical protein